MITKGPWIVDDESQFNLAIRTDYDPRIIIAGVNFDIGISHEEMEANARLLAAAPELLAALKEAVDLFDVFAGPETLGGIWLAASQAAIAKAEGQPYHAPEERQVMGEEAAAARREAQNFRGEPPAWTQSREGGE